MAYFTYFQTQRDLTEAESAQVDSYISAQITAGTTDGERYSWTTSSSSPTPDISRSVRMWGTIESATGYKTLFAGFSPTVPIALY
jgi:hypothetical protein